MLKLQIISTAVPLESQEQMVARKKVLLIVQGISVAAKIKIHNFKEENEH